MSYVHKINVIYVDYDTGIKAMLLALYCESSMLVSHLRYLAINQIKQQVTSFHITTNDHQPWNSEAIHFYFLIILLTNPYFVQVRSV